MKKSIWIIGFTVALLASLVIAGLAFAQSQTPPAPVDGFGPGYGAGRGRMGSGTPGGMMGRWGRGGMMGGTGFGPMHEYMIAALAAELELNVDDVQARIEAGETPLQIIESTGVTAEEAGKLMLTVHEKSLDAAVAADALTQEQADWMNERMQWMAQNGRGMGQGYGRGPCHGGQPAQPTQPAN